MDIPPSTESVVTSTTSPLSGCLSSSTPVDNDSAPKLDLTIESFILWLRGRGDIPENYDVCMGSYMSAIENIILERESSFNNDKVLGKACRDRGVYLKFNFTASTGPNKHDVSMLIIKLYSCPSKTIGFFLNLNNIICKLFSS